MDPVKAGIVILITLVVIVIINLAIYVYAKRSRRGLPHEIEMLKRAANRARNPWVKEDAMLEELSRLTEALKGQPADRQEEMDEQ
jgi:uncharacterized membrane protein